MVRISLIGSRQFVAWVLRQLRETGPVADLRRCLSPLCRLPLEDQPVDSDFRVRTGRTNQSLNRGIRVRSDRTTPLSSCTHQRRLEPR